MRAAVISDIHGNLPALLAVLDDIARIEPAVDAIWCLGDVVGYGASPDECTALTADRADVCLAGNHDLVVCGTLDISHFSRGAAAAARWTANEITPQTRDFLRTLEPLGQAEGVGLYHASPRDPVWEYVLSLGQAEECLEIQRERICLIGHSHVACYFTSNGEVDGALAPPGLEINMEQGRWLVNPGSVGQPRDGDPRAAYLVLDVGLGRAGFRRVDYPINEAASAIVEAGLPTELAQRLSYGQ